MPAHATSWFWADALTERRAFAVAWGFLAVASVLGLLLRVQGLHAFLPLNSAYLLHTHSHTAFLGWVYNAFFALALRCFVPSADLRGYRLLFVVTQIATVGMLFTFPFQGYARESIVFSTLHVICEGVFAWKLLRNNRASPAARTALRWAFAFMLVSAAGPMALGPIAAAGMRGTTWYSLAIYFYLHFQYNGWFVFFLLAVLFLRRDERNPEGGQTAGRAVHWLAAGCVPTVALSALWASPPPWVAAIGIAGAAVQLIGAVHLARALRGYRALFGPGAAGWLAWLAAAAFLLKLGLQFAAGWPGIVAFASHRMVVIGFLHLVFLGAVTPLLIACAAEFGWLRIRGMATAGLMTFLAGALVTELVLFAQPLPALLPAMPPWPRLLEWLAGGAALLALGVLMMFAGLRVTGARPADPMKGPG